MKVEHEPVLKSNLEEAMSLDYMEVARMEIKEFLKNKYEKETINAITEDEE